MGISLCIVKNIHVHVDVLYVNDCFEGLKRTWISERFFHNLTDQVKHEDSVTSLGVPRELVDPVQQLRVLPVREQAQQTTHGLGGGS